MYGSRTGDGLGPQPPSSRNVYLDAIRAGAIFEVLLNHLLLVQRPNVPRWLDDLFRGPAGVQVFLVLSGWLLGGQLMRAQARGRIDIARFWGRRWLRTLPAYYAVLGLRTVSGSDSVPQALAMLLFAQNYTAPAAWAVSWSLCLQEQFYLLLPLVLMVVGRRPRLGIAVGIAALLIPLGLRWHAFDAALSESDYFAKVYAPTHMRADGLVVGVLLAAVRERSEHVWAWLCKHGRTLAVGGIATIAVIDAGPWFFSRIPDLPVSGFASGVGVVALSLGAAMLIPAAAGARPPERRFWQLPLTWIAEHAYALYLLHTSVFVAVRAMGERFGLPQPAVAILMLSGALCAAWVLRAAVEKPALRLRDRVLAPGREARPP